MKAIVLGSGGSNGVPQVGCNCFTCSSPDPKNQRTRASIIIQSPNATVLIDTSPDLRQQLLQHDISSIDALIYTHDHSDHTAGIDDMKLPAFITGNAIPSYMYKPTYDSLVTRCSYVFQNQSALYKPFLKPIVIKEYDTIKIKDINIHTYVQHHGDLITLGIKVNDFAYSIDYKFMPERSLSILQGIKSWLVDCQRYHWSPSHLNYELTLKYIEKIAPENAYLSHLAHDIEYHELKNILPLGIQPAYDGLIINISS